MPTNNIGLRSFAVAFANVGNHEECPLCPLTFTIVLQDLGFTNQMGYTVYVSTIRLKLIILFINVLQDLFDSKQILGLFKPKDEFTVRINPSGVEFYKFKPEDIY